MMWRKGTLRLYTKMVPRERRRRVALQPLIEEQKRTFVRDGFPHAPELVPLRLLARARRAINHSIGSGIDADELNQSFCTELRDDLRMRIRNTAWKD